MTFYIHLFILCYFSLEKVKVPNAMLIGLWSKMRENYMKILNSDNYYLRLRKGINKNILPN